MNEIKNMTVTEFALWLGAKRRPRVEVESALETWQSAAYVAGAASTTRTPRQAQEV